MNNLVFVHRWSLIVGSFIQKISIWETKSTVAIDRELLFQGGLYHRFDCLLKESYFFKLDKRCMHQSVACTCTIQRALWKKEKNAQDVKLFLKFDQRYEN